jgi:hypothetical protein
MTVTIPAPLKTILCPVRYPYAVAQVKDGKIVSTVAYQDNWDECYRQTRVWRQAYVNYNHPFQYIMVEMREIGEKTPNRVNTYWCAV